MATNLGGSVIQLSLRGDTRARWLQFNPMPAGFEAIEPLLPQLSWPI